MKSRIEGSNRKKKRKGFRFTQKDIKQLMLSSNLNYLGGDRIGKNFAIAVGERW